MKDIMFLCLALKQLMEKHASSEGGMAVGYLSSAAHLLYSSAEVLAVLPQRRFCSPWFCPLQHTSALPSKQFLLHLPLTRHKQTGESKTGNQRGHQIYLGT